MSDGKISFPWWLPVLSLIGYYIIGYHSARHEFLPLILVYTLLFIGYLWIYQKAQSTKQVDAAIYASILFRLSLLLAIPNLSDDFYRFIWDGHLFNAGISPFSQLPSDLITNSSPPPGIEEELYKKLNSPGYFTVYPPLNQVIFWLSTYLFPTSISGSVLVMRVFILAAEFGTINLMRKLLRANQMPENNALLYALNPLVIIELTGNLHFEALVILFLIWSLFALYRTKLVAAAVTLGLSIGSKLVPLIFLPLLLKRLSLKKLSIFYGVVAVALLILFAPLLFDPSFISGMSHSLSLYFQKFEFNASIYYVIREIGFAVKGYNIIATSGKGLALATLIGILTYSLLQKPKVQPLSQAMLWALTIYLGFATTIHPWYVAPLVALAVLGRFRFPILWSFLIFFTYIGYTKTGFEENLAIVGMEYLLVAAVAVWEIYYPSENRERIVTINS